jgi:hypothetical protein
MSAPRLRSAMREIIFTLISGPDADILAVDLSDPLALGDDPNKITENKPINERYDGGANSGRYRGTGLLLTAS